MIRLGLIGYPLEHSFSPKIHASMLRLCELEGEYALYPIPQDDEVSLAEKLRDVRSGHITGLNVTIPHKRTIIPLLDQLSPTAKAIGAVNTIFEKDGRLIGENTDASGFLTDLCHTFPHLCEDNPDMKKALIMGAGGAARATTYALLNNGWQVVITARRPSAKRDHRRFFFQNRICPYIQKRPYFNYGKYAVNRECDFGGDVSAS